MEIDNPIASKGCISMRKEVAFPLPELSPCAYGEGLPYAPVNWPNAGDIWSWRVGKRVGTSGFFHDRSLIAPRRLQKIPNKKLVFKSKPSVTHYLSSEFPNADIGAFFASFTWKIPAKLQFWKKAKVASGFQKVHKLEGKEAEGEAKRRKKLQTKSAHSTTGDGHFTIGISSKSENLDKSNPTRQNLNRTTNSETCQLTNPNVVVSPSHGPTATYHTLVKSQAEVMPEDFDNYLESLDDLLAQQPLQEVQYSPTTVELNEEMRNARKKLSEILGMDLRALLSSKELISEITTLSSKLEKDSSLCALQRRMLKLIEEIPTASVIFVETKKVEAEAEIYFDGLKTKIALATNLKNEYNASKEETALLQAEIDSRSLAMKEIDEQISILQCQRAEKSSGIETTKKEISGIMSKLKMMIDCLPKVVKEIQLAQSERSIWELKQQNAAEREAEILDKFSLLKRFC